MSLLVAPPPERAHSERVAAYLIQAKGRLEEHIRLSPNPMGKKAMPFSGAADPEQLTILMTALNDYCRANGIQRENPERLDAARLVMALYNNGATTPEQLKASLASRPRPLRA